MDRLDEAKAGLKILFLDACRNNPYSRGFRSGDRGLARIGTAPSGTLIHYATRPGSVAADGNGANGLYTSQLLKHLDAANIPVEAVLKRVSAAVEAASSGQQEPWTEGSIKGEFYFRGGAGPATQVASLEPQPIAAQVPGRKPGQSQPEAAPTLVADPAETAYWAEVVKSQSEADLKAYLQAYPNGAYVQKAQQLLEQQQVQKRQQEQAKEDQAWANAQQANDYNSYNNFTGQDPNSRYTPLAKLKASKLQGQTVQDCSECPKMVVIPSGSFTMGSSNGASNEKPPHQVSVKSYLLGQTLVTQGQWRAIMGSNPSHFANCGDTCPVENINWNDAQAFATALSKKTGMNYRLPSEAEWEYAARAGTNTKWSFGDNESELGQYAWYSANSNDQTHPVAQKKPNAWGLYDMHGNAWEWMQDVHHDSYSGAPTDGGAWTSGGDQARRVLRGGSWNDYPGDLRSAYRNWYTPDFRNTNLGLRIARTL